MIRSKRILQKIYTLIGRSLCPRRTSVLWTVSGTGGSCTTSVRSHCSRGHDVRGDLPPEPGCSSGMGLRWPSKDRDPGNWIKQKLPIVLWRPLLWGKF